MAAMGSRHWPLAVLTGLLLCGPATAGSPAVPLDDPVYSVLDALPLPGSVEGVNTTSRPYTETQVRQLLAWALNNQPGPDSTLLRHYLDLFTTPGFSRDVSIRKGRLQVSQGDNAVILYPTWLSSFGVQDSNFSLTGFKPYGLDSLSDNRGFTTTNTLGIVAMGSVHDVILYFDGRIQTRYSAVDLYRREINLHKGIFQTTIFSDSTGRGHLVGIDQFRTYAQHSGRFLNVKVGNDHVAWGRSRAIGLMLSPIEHPYFNIQLQKSVGKLDFQYVWGRLTADSADQRRHIYAKRYTYQATDWLSLGYADQVITINRDLEPVYLFPFLPFYFSERFIGDPDNRLMSFDVCINIRRHAAVYGELFMDDILNLAGFFTNKDASDKWAGLLGVKVFNPLGRIPSVLTAEISQVEPWVYSTSARDNQGVYNYPVHFGQILGHPYGPHSRSVKIALSAWSGHRINATLQIEQLWKGAGAGSSEFDVNGRDTLDDGSIKRQYTTKEYRFKNFSRNRTILSGRLEMYPRPWWTLFGGLVAIREREPRTDNAVQVELGTRLNY